MSDRPLLVIGAGPAGLMAAERLASSGASVIVFDAMPSPARKFLMAGRGGLNLTHAEPWPRFLARYGQAQDWLAPLIARFPPDATRRWCHDLGIDSFVASSGRVFPVTMKASPLLRAWLERLRRLGVALRLRHRWTGWDEAGRARFVTPEGATITLDYAAMTLALGGASWPRLGSDGGWTAILAERGVALAPFHPANSGFKTGWSGRFLERAEGMPLKRLAVRFGDRCARGELVITRQGLEGGALYALFARGFAAAGSCPHPA
jgi:uncharacterized flavoprotein (TIGR03862 family)